MSSIFVPNTDDLVSFDRDQNLTAPQQAQALDNIGLNAKVKSLADLSTPASTSLLAMNSSGQVVGFTDPLGGSVFRFGARGDGTVDDTVAIQSALNSGEKVIVIPPSSSHFRITDSLTVPVGVKVTGGGKIVQETAGRNGLVLNNDCTVDGIQITGRHVVGNPTNSTVDNGVYASGRRNITVKNCIVDGWICGGVQVRECFNVSIANNLFFGSTWDFSNAASGVGSDVMVYSVVDGSRFVITGNRCLSNNSQGILFSASGQDSDATISNNICIPLHNWALPNPGTGVGGVGLLNRRHGIVVSYGGTVNSGKVSVANNVCQHTLVSGIYVAASEYTTGVVVIGNVCRDNGYATASDSTLAGGISINGPTQGTLVHSNVIETFRGVSSCGAIQLNDGAGVSEGSYSVKNNYIRGSTAHGIRVNQDIKQATIEGNEIREVTLHDIHIASDVNFHGRIIRNETYRSNSDAASIVIETLTPHEMVVEGNILTGTTTAGGDDNNGIRVNQTLINRIRIRNNIIRNFRRGIRFIVPVNTRELQRFRIEGNEFINCDTGVLLFSSTGTAFVAVGVVPNRFRDCVTRYGDSSGWNACFEGPVKAEMRIEIEGTAPPTSGQPATQTWVRGDRVVNSAPTAGQPKSWVCTVGGAPGTWVSEGNL